METTNIFGFEELSPEVQEKVIEEHQEKMDLVDWDAINEDVTEFFAEKLKEKGLPCDDVRYSLSHCRGDEVAFYGNVDIKEYVEKNSVDFDWLAVVLVTEVFEKSSSLLDKVRVRITKSNQHYDHYNSMDVYVDLLEGELTPEEESAAERLERHIQENIKDVSRELEKLGYDILDSYFSNEWIKETLIENGYKFLKDGRVV